MDNLDIIFCLVWILLVKSTVVLLGGSVAVGYVKTLNIFGDDNAEILCMIDDCIFNKDAV